MPSPQLWFVPPADQGGSTEEPQLWLSQHELDWGSALPLPRRQQYWRSRAALRQVLAAVLERPAARVPLHSPPGAPPQLADELGWVSLSHAAGALLLAWSSHPVGVDLECSARRFDAVALMQRFFPAAERRQLAALAAEPLRQAVLRSWVAKEAAIKWRQRSLAQELGVWCLDHQRGVLSHHLDGIDQHPLEGVIEGCRWAAVGEGFAPLAAATQPLIWRFKDE